MRTPRRAHELRVVVSDSLAFLAVKLPKILAAGLKMHISGPKQPRVVPVRYGGL